MSDRLTERASAMLAINGKQNRRNMLLAIASAVIVLATVYFLALPASSLTESAYCGKEAHEHSADCYSSELICEIPTEPADAEVHSHADACYTTEKVLVCELTESSLSPDEAESNQGTEGDIVAADEPDSADPVEASETPESSHVHTDTCYEQISTLACGLEEGETLSDEAHVHADTCYVQELSCNVEEHVHSVACYSNPNADVEAAADWEATMPDELSGVWADDLIATAESQLGYAESDANYKVTEDGKIKGYTRYGAWYGDSYGDWCAMFVSFCLNYAGISEDSFPSEANCQNWIELLSSGDYQMYYPVGEYAEAAAAAIAAGETECDAVPDGVLAYFEPNEPYAPIPGDIVFFSWDSDYESDHVGIVVEVTEATEDEPARLKTIEGNASDMVKYCEYDLNDASIMGYAALPIKPEGEAVAYDSSDSRVSLFADESSVIPTGTAYYYGKNETFFYQDSSHSLYDTSNDSHIVTTFIVVPSSTASDGKALTPTSDWTAKSSSNYIVTYCCDLETSVGTDPVNYTSYLLEESRISDPSLQASLSALVSHSYPFISESDMKAELKAAYQAGEMSVDVSSSSADEYIAAAQWAIWETTTLNGSLSYASGSSFTSWLGSYMLNRLASAGLTNNETIKSHCYAIKEYLVNLDPQPGKLAVSSYTSDVSQNEDGSYELSVAVTFNRAMRGDESLTALLQAGNKSSESVAVMENSNQITLSLSGLTESELYDAEVRIVGNGAHMQAYHFDSETKQDMLGARWETYDLDLSFELSRDVTSVAVTKVWADESAAHPDSVSVQLVRNGLDYGDPVLLSEEGGWAYEWIDLPKYDYRGEAYQYTVSEQVPPGYEASISTVESGTEEMRVWKSVDALASGGTYIFLSKLGALGTDTTSSSKLTWGAFDFTPASDMPNLVRWSASANGEGWTLTNQANNSNLTLSSSSVKYGEGSTFYLTSDKKLYGTSGKGNTKRYFTSISNATGNTTTNASQATVFTVYELQTVEVPQSDVSFLITNTPVITTAVTVEKKWVDSDDPYRPESIQVSLLANGEVQETVTLDAGSGWIYDWEELPLRDENDALISYSVQEEDTFGYDVEVTADGNYFTITNTKDYYVLPETGGVGKAMFTALGMGLIGIVFVNLVLRRRRIE